MDSMNSCAVGGCKVRGGLLATEMGAGRGRQADDWKTGGGFPRGLSAAVKRSTNISALKSA